MDVQSLTALAEEHLHKARDASSGRSALTVHGGRDHHLRQTLLALRAGVQLGEHDSPGEATLQVLTGEVVLHGPSGSNQSWPASAGDLLPIPPMRHDLAATTDAVVLLTVLTR
ncbi:MAG: LuxR family transcriptional regulator [Nocardioidaceae bacterium]|nr:LuxR family transcriptional regulator [Nocardioidaceae bacterium]